jgi:phenylacetate-CoA ligase
VFQEAGFDPGKIRDLEELKVLPVSKKETLIEHNDEIHTTAPFRKLFQCETSGTSGQVLTFRRDEYWDSANRAAAMRGYSWYGVEPWDRSVYFWGFNIRPRERARVRILDAFQNRFRAFSYEDREIRRLAMRTRRAVVLHGYSSMIFNVAKAFNEDPSLPKPERLKLVKGTSEKIFPAYQEEARKAFGRKIVSEYGAAEAGLIAFECPSGSMHIHLEGCHVEEVDGEILVTNLLSYSFPVIRYRLGDSVQLASDDFLCPCGMAHPVITEVLGRVGKVVYGKVHKYPSLTFYYVFKNLFFEKGISLTYQAKQHERGCVDIDIEQDAPEYRGAVLAEIRKNFGEDLDCTVRFGQAAPPRQEKRRDFVSFIDE